MSDHDWSRLLKIQDQYVHQQDKKQQQRKLKLKLIYKNELEKMIQHQRQNAFNEKQHDVQLMNLNKQKQQKKMIAQMMEKYNKAKIKINLAKDNLNQSANKREKSFDEYERNKRFYNQRFKKVLTQVQQQNKNKIKFRQFQRQQLSKAYDSQIFQQRNRKALEKLQDQKFLRLRQQLSRKNEKDRIKFFENIKSNYKQNPEVYQYSANLIMSQQKQRKEFLSKIEKQDKGKIQLQLRRKKQIQKEKQTKQTSQFNRKYFQTKMMRQRYQSLQQIADYNQKYKRLQTQMQNERYQHEKEMEQRRNKLKIQLEKQIDQSYTRQFMEKQMNQKQYSLNKSGNIPALPGLTKDYKSEKQYKILQNFLMGNSQKSVP